MLEQFDGSLYNMLVEMYPDVNWNSNKLGNWRETLKGPKNNCVYLFLDIESKFKFVKELEEQLNIKNQEDWKQISNQSLKNISLPPNWK